MARLENYPGSIELIDQLTPANGGKFPLVQANDVVVDEDGHRLDEILETYITGVNALLGEGF